MVSDNNGNPMNSRIKSDEVDIFLPDWTDREFKEIQSSEISDFKLDKTITCGIWCFRGKLLQKCANETLFAVLFGILSSMLTASFTYYSATIATVEKRFSIPNVNTGNYSITNLFLIILCSRNNFVVPKFFISSNIV